MPPVKFAVSVIEATLILLPAVISGKYFLMRWQQNIQEE